MLDSLVTFKCLLCAGHMDYTVPLVPDSLVAGWKCTDNSEKYKVRFDGEVGCSLNHREGCQRGGSSYSQTGYL